MAERIRVRSLAKINLDLRVLERRTDGFHELRTIFQTVSLADTIEIEYRPGRTQIDIKSNLNIPDNIIERTADSVLRATGRTGRIGFVLRKRIPLGGGLGGGSSNAAAVLMALPALLKRPISVEKMIEIGSKLGSDVPFFLLGGTAAGVGRGTELYPLPDFRKRAVLLVAPGVHVSTAAAYQALGRTKASQPAAAPAAFLAAAWGAPETFANDFESVVFELHPQLKSIKGKLLKLGARPALMSGSGSCVFGIFESLKKRDRAAVSMRASFPGCEVYPVRMVSRGQYRALWRRQLAAFVDPKLWPHPDRYAK